MIAGFNTTECSALDAVIAARDAILKAIELCEEAGFTGYAVRDSLDTAREEVGSAVKAITA